MELTHLPSVIVTTLDEAGNEVPVGCCMQQILGDMSKLFVHEHHRRRGIASFLVVELARMIRAEGDELPPFAHVELENVPSLALFQSLGFAEWEEKVVWAHDNS